MTTTHILVHDTLIQDYENISALKQHQQFSCVVYQQTQKLLRWNWLMLIAQDMIVSWMYCITIHHRINKIILLKCSWRIQITSLYDDIGWASVSVGFQFQKGQRFWIAWFHLRTSLELKIKWNWTRGPSSCLFVQQHPNLLIRFTCYTIVPSDTDVSNIWI